MIFLILKFWVIYGLMKHECFAFGIYEVHYDSKKLHDNHQRVSRALASQIDFHFESYGRKFYLNLRLSQSLFQQENIDINGINYPISDFSFYEGKLNNDPSSHVIGTIIDGVFYGSIEDTKNGKYFIESSKRHKDVYNSPSVLYHESILHNSTVIENPGLGKNGGCADKLIHEIKQIQKMAFEEKRFKKSDNKIRNRRETLLPFPNEKNVCDLFLKVDPFFYKQIYDNEGSKSDSKTLSFIMNYLNKYVSNLNTIFSSLEFYNSDKTSSYKGIKFAISRTRVITESMCANNTLSEADLKLCEKYVDVQTFLNYVSLGDYTDFCLSYTFTARDFADGTLGLAWVAKPSGSIGGICTERQVVQDTEKSLNCGIVTVTNYQTRVLDLVTMITFAHEIGHNFGAEHDPKKCAPDDKNGNYIMYAQVTTGTKVNNNKFSECSKDSMSAVVYSIITDSERNCFKIDSVARCGNRVVEEGEECDCGYETECTEKCCYSADQSSDLKCKLKNSAVCSPSQGQCCTSDCVLANSQSICFGETECTENVYCSGLSSLCPFTDSKYFKNSKTGGLKECNDGTQVCKNGICSGSICEKYNMTQCYLEGNLADKNVNKIALCHLACIGTSQNDSCIDTYEMSLFNYSGFTLQAGSACSGTQGYCDIFSKCRAVNEGSILTRIENLVLNPPSSTDIQTWFQKYWWVFLLIFVGFAIVITILTILIFRITPSSNPKKKQSVSRKSVIDIKADGENNIRQRNKFK